VSYLTRNTFCGTWSLPHSQVHNDWTVSIKISAIWLLNKGYIVHCACTIWPYFHFQSKIRRHHRVPQPQFPVIRGNFGDLHTFKAYIGLVIFSLIFRTSSPKMWVLRAKWGRDGAMLTPNELVFTFGGSYVCANFGENLSRNATVRVRTDGHTASLTGRNQFYNLSDAVCYRFGTDNNIKSLSADTPRR